MRDFSIGSTLTSATQNMVFKAHVPSGIDPTFATFATGTFATGPLASASFLPQKNKEQLVIREIDEPQSANSPITGKRRKRIGGDSVSPKRSQLSLAIGRHNIDATTLGLLPL